MESPASNTSVWSAQLSYITSLSKVLFYGKIIGGGIVCIEDMSLKYHMPKHIKPMRSINKITWGCETCISAMLLQYDLNKLRWTQLEK